VTVQRLSSWAAVYRPVGSGRRGTTTQPPSGAEQCPTALRAYWDRLRDSVAFLQGNSPCRINYHTPTEKSKTHGLGSDQIQRTEVNSLPRHSGVAEASGPWRLGPTVYVVYSFRIKCCSVTSVTVQMAFLLGGGIPPRRFGDCGARHRSCLRGRNGVRQRNEPSRTDCGSIRPSYTARHRAG
jgi:hypothetical protein